jgi:hypothetical protein
MRLECESDWDGVIATFAHPRYELVEFWLTGTHLGPLRTPKGEIAPTRKSVSGTDDGELRIRARVGQNYLRAALFRPARRRCGARVGPSEHPLPLNRHAKRFIPGVTAARPNPPLNKLLEVSVLHQQGSLNPSLRSRARRECG